MFASEAVDEGIGGSEDLIFDILESCLIVICSQAWDLLAADLDEIVETIAAGLEAFLEEPEFAFVALLLGDGHQLLLMMIINSGTALGRG